eukprot:325013-Amphidinium_carterae.1
MQLSTLANVSSKPLLGVCSRRRRQQYLGCAWPTEHLAQNERLLERLHWPAAGSARSLTPTIGTLLNFNLVSHKGHSVCRNLASLRSRCHKQQLSYLSIPVDGSMLYQRLKALRK